MGHELKMGEGEEEGVGEAILQSIIASSRLALIELVGGTRKRRRGRGKEKAARLKWWMWMQIQKSWWRTRWMS